MLSLVMGAAPEDDEIKRLKEEGRAMFASGIEIIAASPFGGTAEGKEIVNLLSALNARGAVVYGETLEGARGDWDGQTIRVDEDFRGKAYRTIPELVHEASHALWKKRHNMGQGGDKRKNDIDDELHARENQLTMYKYLRDKKHWPQDAELERRLQLQAQGKLRESIEQSFPR